MTKIKLGVKAKDKITGFEGIVIAQSKWLTNCDQYALKPKVDKEGKIQEASWFDVGQLEVIGEGIHAKEVKSKTAGGPQSDAPRA